MSKHGFVLLLAALVGCKYAALPSLSGTHDSSPGTDGKTDGSADAGHPDGATPDSPPDAAICPATSACIEAPISGWNGPAIFYDGAVGTSPPACSGDYDMTAAALNGGLDGGSATCACKCGIPTGTSCGSATLTSFNQLTCPPLNPVGSETLPPGTCEPFNLAGSYYVLGVPNVTGGSCTASLNKNIPPPTWSSQFRACTSSATLTGAGCSADQVCAPRPATPFDPQICIYASGDVACPSGSSYSNKIVRYESFTDTRDCSGGCTCGAPSGSCAGQVSLTEGPTTAGCGTVADAHLTPGGCDALSPGNAVHAIYNPAPAPTCTPSTSTLMGMLSATQPTTFCCLTPP
jgi:hypothetical protein